MNSLVLKKAYVRSMRGLKGAAQTVGLLGALERSDNRIALWARSLFGIYDSQDLLQLDLPWWTFQAVDRVTSFLKEKDGKARVFEYGAGASTVWLAKRAAEVWSVEHDVAFVEQLRPVLEAPGNVKLSVVPAVPATGRPGEARSKRAGNETLAFDDYVGAIGKAPGEFDLIVVDGRSRCACLAAALPRLAPGGIILFDNSERDEYQAALVGSRLRVERLRGMAPALPLPSETSLLRREA